MSNPYEIPEYDMPPMPAGDQPSWYDDSAERLEQDKRSLVRYILRYSGVFLATGVAGLSFGYMVGDVYEQTQATADSTENSNESEIQSGAIPRTPIENTEHSLMNEDRWQELHDAALKVNIIYEDAEGKKSIGSCTGTFLNEGVVLAKHCLETEPGSSINAVGVYRGEELDLVMRGDAWAMHPEKDVAVVTGTIIDNDLKNFYVPAIADVEVSPIEVGRQFFISGLPGDATAPVSAGLTYVGAGDMPGEHWLLLEEDDESKACNPGASGSLVTDGAETYGVLSSYGTPEIMNEEEWQGWLDYASSLSGYGIDQERAKALCGVSLFNGNEIGALFAEARANEE